MLPGRALAGLGETLPQVQPLVLPRRCDVEAQPGLDGGDLGIVGMHLVLDLAHFDDVVLHGVVRIAQRGILHGLHASCGDGEGPLQVPRPFQGDHGVIPVADVPPPVPRHARGREAWWCDGRDGFVRGLHPVNPRWCGARLSGGGWCEGSCGWRGPGATAPEESAEEFAQ